MHKTLGMKSECKECGKCFTMYEGKPYCWERAKNEVDKKLHVKVERNP